MGGYLYVNMIGKGTSNTIKTPNGTVNGRFYEIDGVANHDISKTEAMYKITSDKIIYPYVHISFGIIKNNDREYIYAKTDNNAPMPFDLSLSFSVEQYTRGSNSSWDGTYSKSYVAGGTVSSCSANEDKDVFAEDLFKKCTSFDGKFKKGTHFAFVNNGGYSKGSDETQFYGMTIASYTIDNSYRNNEQSFDGVMYPGINNYLVLIDGEGFSSFEKVILSHY